MLLRVQSGSQVSPSTTGVRPLHYSGVSTRLCDVSSAVFQCLVQYITVLCVHVCVMYLVLYSSV